MSRANPMGAKAGVLPGRRARATPRRKYRWPSAAEADPDIAPRTGAEAGNPSKLKAPRT
jgi:hypothetical protein